MICLPARLPRPHVAARAAAALAVGALGMSAPLLAAQEAPGSYQLPPPSPTPTPRPAGPADERAGVAIPPRALPAPRATPTITASPSAAPGANATPTPAPRAQPAPGAASSTTRPPVGTPAPSTNAAPLPSAAASASPSAGAPGDPLTSLPALPSDSLPAELPAGPPSIVAAEPAGIAAALPGWWPSAAGIVGAVAALALAELLRRRRKPKVLRLAAPVAGTASEGAAEAALSAELPRLDLSLEITGATRSVMMFTLNYRLIIANRTPRAANDLSLAVQIACARRGAGNAASPGAAQALSQVERIGPHQSRTVTGSVQLPLSAIAVLQQGGRPLFIPLVHVTLEGAGSSVLARSFVIGTPSASGVGRLHPIVLEGPPGSIADLRAQLVEIPAVPAAA